MLSYKKNLKIENFYDTLMNKCSIRYIKFYYIYIYTNSSIKIKAEIWVVDHCFKSVSFAIDFYKSILLKLDKK